MANKAKRYGLRRSASAVTLAIAATTGLGLALPGAASAATTSTPYGAVDVVQQTIGDNVLIAGWAIDPDTASAINVAVYVDGVANMSATADASRTDVGTAYPAYGSTHGYYLTVDLGSSGQHTVDVYAIDSSGNGDNPLLGRTTVTAATTPFGAVDVVKQTTGNTVQISGWAIDPDTNAAAAVAIYVDGVATTQLTADASRSDIGAAYPAYGSDHGYNVTLDLGSSGSHTIDVYAIDTSGNADNPLLARRTVTIATTAFGSLDVATQASGNDVTVAGWAIDPDTTSAISVVIYVDGIATKIVSADGSRTDVGDAYPTFGSNHGYSATVTLAASGSHTIDVYAIDSTGNSANTHLGRKTVDFVLV